MFYRWIFTEPEQYGKTYPDGFLQHETLSFVWGQMESFRRQM